MTPKIKTRKEANGTYSWKLVTKDYSGSWTSTQARTPWGARVQGAPFLADELKAVEIGKRLEAKFKNSRYIPTDLMLEG